MKTFNSSLVIAAFGMTSISTASYANTVIDFEQFSNADQVSLIDYGFGTASIQVNGGINEAWVYDTNNAQNGDADLTANFNSVTGGQNNYNPGNILIIQENQPSKNGTRKPDDNGSGGVIEFTFISGLTLQSIDLFDASKNVYVILRDQNDNLIVPAIQNNFNADTSDNQNPNLYGTLDFGGISNVHKMNVVFDNVSGGLDNIVIISVPEHSTYALMMGGLGLVGLVAARRNKKV